MALYTVLRGGKILALAHVAGGVHVRVTALQAVIHQDAEFRLNAAAFQELNIGPHPRGGNHHVGTQAIAVVQLYRQSCGAILLNCLNPGRGQYVNTLVQAPLFYQVPGSLVHHARDHAVFHFDHRQVYSARRKRLQDYATDKACSHQENVGSFTGIICDIPAVLQGPAGKNTGQIQSRDGGTG